MVLYPNEKNKTYFGLSYMNQIQDYGIYGEEVTATLPVTRQSTIIGLGFRPSKQTTFVLSDALIVNQSTSGKSKTGIGDPSLEGRYTFIELSSDRPFYPQIQGIIAVKPGWANSVYEQEENSGLDVFGSGFHEGLLGADLWWGTSKLRFGFVNSLNLSLTRKDNNGVNIQKGIELQTLGSAAVDLFNPLLSLSTGLEHQRKMKDMRDGKQISSSEVRQNNAFLSLKWTPQIAIEWRLSYFAAALFGSRENATSSRSTTLGYARSI